MTQQTKNKNHLKLLCLGVSLPASFYHLLLTQKAELSMPEAPHIVHCYKYLCLASYQWSIVETKKITYIKQKEETVQSVSQEKTVLSEEIQIQTCP